MDLTMNMQLFWLILLIIFLIAELLTSFTLTSIWFCVGALGAIIVAGLGFGVVIQSIVFIIISGLMLYFTKPFLYNVLGVKYEPTNADKIIGTSCPVIEAIDNHSNTGLIKFEGKIWKARSVDNNTVIEVGSDVIVDRIEGVTVYVKYNKGSEI